MGVSTMPQSEDTQQQQQQQQQQHSQQYKQSQWAAAAYAVMMVCVGIPVWWKTTEVYRAPLPYSDIASLAGIHTKQAASVFLLCLEEEECGVRAPELQKLLAHTDAFHISLNVKQPFPSERRMLSESSSLAQLDSMLGPTLLRDSPGSVALVEVPSVLFHTVPHIVLGNHRLIYYSTYTSTKELAALLVDTVLGEPRLAATLRSLHLTTHPRPAPSHTVRKRTSGATDLFLTLLVPQPEYVEATWDIEAATETYLRPFLNTFPLNFTVKSQVLYLTPLDIPAAQTGSGPLDLVPEQLGLAVNSVETALASQASSNPAINLLVYLPPIERTPLTVQGSPSNSFLIPRWGGVTIYNFLEEARQEFPVSVEVDMETVSGVWLGQLRELLGVSNPTQAEVETLPVPRVGLRVWERDFQLRHRALEYCLDAVSTLASLSHLLSQIPNIVISEEVGSQVARAVTRVREGASLVTEGKLVQGFTAAEEALLLAETAFFDKSLLALLYFPDDQKYAIYIPFFLPVGIPVILSLRTLIKFFRGEIKPKVD